MGFLRQISNKGKSTYVAAANYADVNSLLCVLVCQCNLLIHNTSVNMYITCTFYIFKEVVFAFLKSEFSWMLHYG